MSDATPPKQTERFVGIEITVKLIYQTNNKRTGRREKTVGLYNPEKEYSTAILAAETALQELIKEAKEDFDRQQKEKAERASKGKGRKSKKQALLDAEIAKQESSAAVRPENEGRGLFDDTPSASDGEKAAAEGGVGELAGSAEGDRPDKP